MVGLVLFSAIGSSFLAWLFPEGDARAKNENEKDQGNQPITIQPQLRWIVMAMGVWWHPSLSRRPGRHPDQPRGATEGSSRGGNQDQYRTTGLNNPDMQNAIRR